MTNLTASATALTASLVNNRHTYTGREWDEQLAMYHYRARMYDPTAGRFCSRDPIGYGGSEWDLYEFCKSAPCNETDPTGLSCRISYKCIFTGRRGNGWTSPNATCSYSCSEDTSVPRELRPGGTLTCEDVPANHSYSVEQTVFRCSSCGSDYTDVKHVSDWGEIKNCSRAECQSGVSKFFFKERLACSALGPGAAACRAALVLTEQAALRGCDLCDRP